MFLAVSGLVVEPKMGMVVLIKYLLFLVFLFHIPYIFSVIGGAFFSLLYSLLDHDKPNAMYLRFSQEAIEKSLGGKLAWLFLGVLPLATAVLLFYQYLYGTPLLEASSFFGEIPFDKWALLAPHYAYQWWIAVGLVALGLIVLHVYKNSFSSRKEHFGRHFLLGLAGLGTILLGWFLFTAQTVFLLYPTMWALVDNPVELLFGSVLLSRFGFFLHGALAFSCAGLLYLFLFRKGADVRAVTFVSVGSALLVLPLLIFYLHKIEVSELSFGTSSLLLGGALVIYLLIARVGFALYPYQEVLESEAEKEYYAFVRKVLFGFGLAFSILFAFPAFLDYFFLEEAAFSDSVVVVYFLAIFSAYLLALTYLSGLVTKGALEKCAVPVAICLPLFFILAERTTGANAMREQIRYLFDVASQAAPKELPKEGVLAKLSEKGQKGFVIFKQSCATCHSVDGTRKVGPALDQIFGEERVVLVKGKEKKVKADEAFIKRALLDPNAEVAKGFPAAMPPQNLTEAQIQEVIAFLKDLKKLSEKERKEIQSEAVK